MAVTRMVVFRARWRQGVLLFLFASFNLASVGGSSGQEVPLLTHRKRSRRNPDTQPEEARPAEPEEGALPPEWRSTAELEPVFQCHAQSMDDNAPDQQGRGV